MAGEWIGVVGTAVGASIGGVVTVASLIVRGRHEASRERRRLIHERETQELRIEIEEKRRRRDRGWDVTLEGIQPRRETYIRLLRAVAEFQERLTAAAAREPDGVTAELSRACSLLGPVKDLVAEVDVNSQHREVGVALRRLISQGDALQSTTLDELPEVVAALTTLVEDLINVCRWDLGSYALPPDEEMQRPPVQRRPGSGSPRRDQ